MPGTEQQKTTYDPAGKYGTLVNPFNRSKQDLAEYADFSFKSYQCELSAVDINESQVMLRILLNSFLSGQALVYFSGVIKPKAKNVADALKMLEEHCLNDRAKLVNGQVWDELTFSFVEEKRKFNAKPVSYENSLDDLFNEIAELKDMRTGQRSDKIVMDKILDRDVQEFQDICSNLPGDLQALKSKLHARALEVERDKLPTQMIRCMWRNLELRRKYQLPLERKSRRNSSTARCVMARVTTVVLQGYLTGLNYQKLFKFIERPSDGYSEKADMRNNTTYLVFSSHGFFTESLLCIMHRKLGNPTL